MSDLDEPPAKVLKIDNIDGVTHVTELSEYPAPFDGGAEEEMMGEESGIIEGGADPEPEGQEEWLSEGILTDDDYNPPSQETTDNRTDSQLGSSQEEEHLDSTLDSEALPDNEQHLEQNQQNLGQNEQDIVNNDNNLDKNEPSLESGQDLAHNEQELAQNEQELTQNEKELTHNEQDLAQNEQVSVQNEHYEDEEHLANTSAESESANVVENVQNGMEIDTNKSLDDSQEDIQNTSTNSTTDNQSHVTKPDSEPETIEKLMEMSNLDENVESQTYTQECSLNVEPTVAPTSDIVVQRVLSLNSNSNVKEIKSTTAEMNIEETMKNLEGETEVKSDDFDSLLKQNTDVKSESTCKSEAKQEQDDGNDTDDLLRMLEEDDSKTKKKLTKTVKDIRNAARAADSTDDDEFIYEGTRIKKIKAAQALLGKKKTATKAVPEDTDDDDIKPAEESKTVKSIFGLKSGTSVLRQTQNRLPSNILNVVERPRMPGTHRQYRNKRLGQSLLKPTTPAARPTPVNDAPTSQTNQGRMSFKPSESKASTPFKPSYTQKTVERKTYEPAKIKKEPAKIKYEPTKITEPKIKTEVVKVKTETVKIKNEPVKIKNELAKMRYEPGKNKTESGMIKIEPGKMKVLPEDMVGDEEFLDEEEYGMDEDEFVESDNDISHRQRIMKPEVMDEEVPSDGESGDEDASLYDEMPTSDSDDADDWFQLDIRCEKAGDYLPLLGPRAKELLSEEKRRVSARLSTLKQSHKALAASGREQAAILRRATAALAEIDDMIRAS